MRVLPPSSATLSLLHSLDRIAPSVAQSVAQINLDAILDFKR